MGTTTRGYPYPEATDAPLGAQQVKALALALDTDVATVAAAAAAAGSGGGGGGGSTTVSTVWAGWQASGAQPIATATDVVVAFGTALGGGDGGITRGTSGAGHSFTLGAAKLWTISACVQFDDTSGGGRKVEIRAGATVLAKAGDAAVSGKWSRTVCRGRRLPAGTVITVVVRQDKGTSVALDPDAGPSVSIDISGV